MGRVAVLQRRRARDPRFTDDGWFKTGDIVTIAAGGCIELTDRTKDLVKSGGEWISSVALETALMGHPAVAEAAVIAVPHPKWDERPLAVVVLKPGQTATAEELLEFLAPNFREVVAAGRVRVRRPRFREPRSGSSRSRCCGSGSRTTYQAGVSSSL